MTGAWQRLAVRLTALLALLAVLALLAERGVITLLAWTERVFPIDHYRWLFLLLLAGYAAVSLAPGRARRPILLAVSLASAAIFSVAFLALSLAWLWLFHRVLMAPVRARWKLAFVLATFAAGGVLCDITLFPRFLSEHRAVGLFGYVFAVSYTFRIFWVLHELHLSDYPPIPLLDFLLYFLFAPFFIVIPYMFAIPRLGCFRDGLARPSLAVELSGLRLVAIGILVSLASYGWSRGLAPREHLVAILRQHRYWLIWPVGVLYYPILAVLTATATATVLHGLLRLLGIELAPAFRRPLASASVPEWWRRWNVHFRDFLVELFFDPIALRLRRRGPYLGIIAGCLSVFVVGSTLFHWLAKHYFRHGSPYALPLGLLAENVTMAVTVASALCLARWRELRSRAPLRPSLPRRLGGLLLTYTMVLVSVVLVGRGVTYFRDVAPRERLHARFASAQALVRANLPAQARALMEPTLDDMRTLIRHEPRDPARRLELAYVLALGPDSERADADEQLHIAEGFRAPPLDEDIVTDTTLLLSETRALLKRRSR